MANDIKGGKIQGMVMEPAT